MTELLRLRDPCWLIIGSTWHSDFFLTSFAFWITGQQIFLLGHKSCLYKSIRAYCLLHGQRTFCSFIIYVLLYEYEAAGLAFLLSNWLRWILYSVTLYLVHRILLFQPYISQIGWMMVGAINFSNCTQTCLSILVVVQLWAVNTTWFVCATLWSRASPILWEVGEFAQQCWLMITKHCSYSTKRYSTHRFLSLIQHCWVYWCTNLGWQVQDLDRKVRRGRERLAQDVDLANVVPISTEKSDQLAAIEEKIKRLLEQSENLGEEGKVDEAQALMKKVINCWMYLSCSFLVWDTTVPLHVLQF